MKDFGSDEPVSVNCPYNYMKTSIITVSFSWSTAPFKQCLSLLSSAFFLFKNRALLDRCQTPNLKIFPHPSNKVDLTNAKARGHRFCNHSTLLFLFPTQHFVGMRPKLPKSYSSKMGVLNGLRWVVKLRQIKLREGRFCLIFERCTDPLCPQAAERSCSVESWESIVCSIFHSFLFLRKRKNRVRFRLLGWVNISWKRSASDREEKG